MLWHHPAATQAAEHPGHIRGRAAQHKPSIFQLSAFSHYSRPLEPSFCSCGEEHLVVEQRQGNIGGKGAVQVCDRLRMHGWGRGRARTSPKLASSMSWGPAMRRVWQPAAMASSRTRCTVSDVGSPPKHRIPAGFSAARMPSSAFPVPFAGSCAPKHRLVVWRWSRCAPSHHQQQQQQQQQPLVPSGVGTPPAHGVHWKARQVFCTHTG